MALTAEEKLSIATILPVTPPLLEAQITLLGASLDADRETAIRAELARWDAGAGTNYVHVHPKEANFGAEIDPSDEQADIRQHLLTLFEFPPPAFSGGIGTLQIGV